MIIEVFGTGCPKCNATVENVKKALAELKKDAEIVKVTEIREMIERGIMSTPAVMIDGKLVSQGNSPKVEQIKQWIGKET
jgi:small redox-active disulfide protein 2